MDNGARSFWGLAAVWLVPVLVVGISTLACAAPENAGQSDNGAAVAAPEATGAQGTAGGASISMAHAVDFAGKIHPMVLHFPIVLVLTALLAEFLGLLLGRAMFFQMARFALILAALSVVVAVPLGWAAAVSKEYAEDYLRMLWLHRWFGTFAGVLVVLVACLSQLAHVQRQKVSIRAAYRVGLVLASVIIAFTGHFGALLVYGLDYFSN